jgi:hypothetical protein
MYNKLLIIIGFQTYQIIAQILGAMLMVWTAKKVPKDTPVLMAENNPFKAPALAYSLAALPLISPIQDVKPDDLVKAYHHEQSYYATADNSNDPEVLRDVPGWQDYDYLNITPETWQIGTFEIIEATGSKVEVEANRPKTWYAENNVNAIGDKAWFYMPEIGINGEATLLSKRPTVVNTTNFALNESGQVDRPVITTFKRFAPVVYDYHFSDGSIIGATPDHPFFSIDRNNYIAVGELQLGEQVMTAGQKVVKFIAGKQRDKGEPVYNFEVWRDHNYYVGSKESGEFLLVHNTCPIKLLKEAITSIGIRIKKLNGKLEIPENWEMHELFKPDGTKKGVRYVHPQNPNIQVRVMEEGLVPGKHNHGKPYIKYELGKDANGNMQHADIDGNLIDGNLSASEYFLKSHILVDNIEIIP